MRDGYLERKKGGAYRGAISVEGINLSPIEGVYFKHEGKQYLWLRRTPMLEYDEQTQSYRKRDKYPRWEAYLEKQSGGSVAYKGMFMLLRFCFSIVGIWDANEREKNRIEFFVERMPMNNQTIINNVNERNKQYAQQCAANNPNRTEEQ